LTNIDDMTPFQILKELLDAGYTSAGINYDCGCTGTKWIKDRKVVDEYYTYCERHTPDVLRIQPE
jgi:hypothetical protein